MTKITLPDICACLLAYRLHPYITKYNYSISSGSNYLYTYLGLFHSLIPVYVILPALALMIVPNNLIKMATVV